MYAIISIIITVNAVATTVTDYHEVAPELRKGLQQPMTY